MKKIETHPSPEKLLRQVTEEAVNALALGGPDKIGDEAPMEAGVMLIAKAWGPAPGEPPGQPGPARKGTAAPSQRERRGRPARQRTAGALRRQNDRRAALGPV